jgi:hypothetical protein
MNHEGQVCYHIGPERYVFLDPQVLIELRVNIATKVLASADLELQNNKSSLAGVRTCALTMSMLLDCSG